jgi:hypothetical protein
VVASVSACRHPVERQLQGRWLGEGVENFDDRDLAAATGWAKGTSMEFSGSTITVGIPAEEPRSGKYEIAKVHDADVLVQVERRGGKTDNVSFKLDSEDSIRWMLGEGRAVVLRREQF